MKGYKTMMRLRSFIAEREHTCGKKIAEWKGDKIL